MSESTDDRKAEVLKRIEKLRDLASKSASKLEELEGRVERMKDEVSHLKEEVQEGWREGSDTT